MAQTLELSDETLSEIAKQVSTFVPPIGISLEDNENLELGETFQIWTLPLSEIISQNPLASAQPLGTWHHQLYKNENPVAYVYSRPYGPRPIDWRVGAIFESDIAASLNEAIDVADSQLPGEGKARLLDLRAYLIQALWVLLPDCNSKIIPAVVPSTYREIERLAVYSAEDFFERLKTLKPTVGIQA
jgi:hypothetical protein